MATSIVVMPRETKAASTGKVTLTVERLLQSGQGLYSEPVQVTINNGDTVKTVIDRYMNDNARLNYYYYSTTSGWYLTSILGADNSRVANIPNEIANMQDVYTYSYIGQDDGLLTKEKVLVHQIQTRILVIQIQLLEKVITGECQVGYLL